MKDPVSAVLAALAFGLLSLTIYLGHIDYLSPDYSTTIHPQPLVVQCDDIFPGGGGSGRTPQTR